MGLRKELRRIQSQVRGCRTWWELRLDSVVSFSQAIDEECSSIGANVTVTALCPGPVATEFVAAGDLSGVDVWKNAKSPESVAKVGYNAMMKGKLIAINEWKLKALIYWIVPFMPRRMMLKTSRQSMEKLDV